MILRRNSGGSLSGLAVLSFISLVLSACSPLYILEAAYEEGRILAGREKITDVLADPATPDMTRSRLLTVLSAREFATASGFDVGNSFTRYYDLRRSVFSWVLVASQPDSFALVSWWYPIVGTMPYKGFFDKEDAISEEQELAKEGYETWVRGAETMSTLGWFNDPVMSTTLAEGDEALVNTVLHESFHATVWIPNHVDFNESAANFIGMAGAVSYYEKMVSGCGNSDTCPAREKLANARNIYSLQLKIGDILGSLYDRLQTLYASGQSREEKLRQRVAIFEEETGELRKLHPALSVLKEVNNAELMQLRLYMKQLRDFERLFSAVGSLNAYIECMRSIKARLEEDESQDPFLFVKGEENDICR